MGADATYCFCTKVKKKKQNNFYYGFHQNKMEFLIISSNSLSPSVLSDCSMPLELELLYIHYISTSPGAKIVSYDNING